MAKTNLELKSSATVSTIDDLLTAIFNKNLFDILQDMGHNQTTAMILQANNQQYYNQSVIHTTFELLNHYVPAGSLDMYLDTATRRFALEGSKVSLQKIGKDWDMSRERIRQVERSILRLLCLPNHKAAYLQAIKAVTE